jgi:membrane protease subunit HflK
MASRSTKPQNNPRPRPGGSGAWTRRIVVAVIVLAVVAWFAAGFYFVQPDERAVVRRFGRIIEPKGLPGLHWNWPWPVGRVDKPKTTEVRRVTVGLDPATRSAIAAGDLAARTDSLLTDIFTGDVNIVKATMIAQYQVDEPARYLTQTAEPDRLVELAVQSIMVDTIGGYAVEDALTEAKARIQNTTWERAQETLRRYGCGITLLSVDLESIEPPAAIADAFRDVASAKKDREKAIDEAQSTANSIVAKARGLAGETISGAEGYRDRRVNKARGDTERFSSIYTEYRKAPLVTQTRLLLDTLATVFNDAETYVFEPNKSGPPMRMTIYDNPPEKE